MSNFDLCAYLGRDKEHLFQFALPLEKANPKKLKFPMYASEKFDGVFCAALRLPDGSVGIFSRTGEIYTSMEHLHLACWVLTSEDIPMILFEAYIPNTDQSVISGACRDTKNQHPEIIMIVHTLLVVDNAPAYVCAGYYEVGALEYLERIWFAYHVRINTLAEAKALAESVWARGGEGIVLNAIDAPYQPGKRDESMIKIKKVLSYDLEVVGIYEGKGKYAGTLGGIICRWKNGKTIKVSGMTDEQRNEWYQHPERIVGKIAEVHAMAESSKGLLREPRFKGVRYDKAQADA